MQATSRWETDVRRAANHRRRFAWSCGVFCLLPAHWAEFASAGSYVTVFDYGKLGDWGSWREFYRIAPDGQHAIGGQIAHDEYQVGVFHSGVFAPVTPAPGIQLFDLPGISRDAGVVIYNGFDTSSWNAHAYRLENGVAEDLGYLYTGEGRSTYAAAISADGRIIAGWSSLTENTGGIWKFQSTPYVWNNGVMSALETLADKIAFVSAISADGNTIVGSVYNLVDFIQQPAVWKNGVLTVLPSLSAGTSWVSDVSDDGTTIVGYSDTGAGTYHLVRWVNGQLEQLSSTPFVDYQFPASSSYDGSLAVFANKVWKQDLGVTSLKRYLGYHRGLSTSMSGYWGWRANDMSPDGRYFVGSVMDDDYSSWGYIAYLDPADFAIPEPSTFCLAGLAAVSLLWAKLRWRIQDLSGRPSA